MATLFRVFSSNMQTNRDWLLWFIPNVFYIKFRHVGALARFHHHLHHHHPRKVELPLINNASIQIDRLVENFWKVESANSKTVSYRQLISQARGMSHDRGDGWIFTMPLKSHLTVPVRYKYNHNKIPPNAPRTAVHCSRKNPCRRTIGQENSPNCVYRCNKSLRGGFPPLFFAHFCYCLRISWKKFRLVPISLWRFISIHREESLLFTIQFNHLAWVCFILFAVRFKGTRI